MARCGRPAIDALTIPKSSQDLKNTWKNKWPISVYSLSSMCRYCWMGKKLRWGAARMAQGLASPVMAYLSHSLSISSAPEHSSGLRAVGRAGGGRGSRCHGALDGGRCPMTSSRVEWVRVERNWSDGSTVHIGYHQCSKHRHFISTYTCLARSRLIL